MRVEKKIELVRKRLEPHLTACADGLKLCLIDEAEHGGSIAKNYDLLNGALRIFYPETDFDLVAIAICGPQEKCGRFQQLQEMRRLTPVYVSDLFTVDRTAYLSPLVRRGDDVRQEGGYPKYFKPGLYAMIEHMHRRL